MTDLAAASKPYDVPTLSLGPQPIHIRRLGGRPLRFRGTEVAMAMGYCPNQPFWYEVNVYRKIDDAYVVAVRLFRSAKDERDTVQAWVCGTLDEVVDGLERYEAEQDVIVRIDVADEALAPAELAAQALELRARMETQVRSYASVLGEVLHMLDCQE